MKGKTMFFLFLFIVGPELTKVMTEESKRPKRRGSFTNYKEQ